jgi:dethiobiotin synthetase
MEQQHTHKLHACAQVLSAGLVQAAIRVGRTQYIKPLQTGALMGLDVSADEYTVRTRAHASPSVGPLVHDRLTSSTLFCWPEPRSPHEAAAMAKETMQVEIPSTQHVVDAIADAVAQCMKGITEADDDGVCIIESAGGVLSPGATGEPQGDMYTGLDRLLNHPPVLLVGDAKLGGIAVTLASIEALWRRQYHVPVIAFVEESGYDNASFVRRWANNSLLSSPDVPRNHDPVDVFVFPPLPPADEPLTEWYNKNDGLFDDLFARITKC